VAQVVGRERRHARSRARARDGGAEAIATEALEHASLARTVVAGHELEHGVEGGRRHVHPAPAAIRDGEERAGSALALTAAARDA
jgi:hypothetical protein